MSIEAIAKSLNFGADNLATKEELSELRAELESIKNELSWVKWMLSKAKAN